MQYTVHVYASAVFSLNFSSVGKWPFMASKARKRAPGGWKGSGVTDIATLAGNLGAKSSETSFPHFETYFMQMDCCYL